MPTVQTALPRTVATIALGVFCAAVTMNFVGLFFLKSQWVDWLTKPLPVMALWVLTLGWQSGEGAYARLIRWGLVFSLLGDVLLMLQGGGPGAGKNLFIAGLAAFLTAHLFYIGAFSTGDVALRPWRMVPLTGFAVGMVWLLTPNLGPMLVPVYAYILVITTMVWRAAGRVGHGGESRAAQWWGLVGALSFMLSDSMIAWDRFMGDVPQARLLIMSTYWFGQWGIARSVMRNMPLSRP